VGVALEHSAVHEGTRIALVGVADDVLHRVVLRRRKRPLRTGRKTAAAAAAQAGVLDHLDDLARGHRRQGLAQGRIAVTGEVVVNGLRVDPTGVSQHDTRLRQTAGVGLVLRVVPVALNLAEAGHRSAQAVHHRTGLRRVQLAQNQPGATADVHHLDRRLAVAEPHAAGLDDLHAVRQAARAHFLANRVQHRRRARGHAAGAHGNQNRVLRRTGTLGAHRGGMPVELVY